MNAAKRGSVIYHAANTEEQEVPWFGSDARLKPDDIPYVPESQLKAEKEKSRKLAEALTRIQNGLTTDQTKVEFYTKREAYEALASYRGEEKK